MALYGSNGGRLWLVLMMALGGALISLVMFVQGESPARADEQGGRGPQIVSYPMIVGGTAVPDGKYPFIAALIDTRVQGNTPYDQHRCGGTLIDKNGVLTAGHCVDDYLAVPGVQLSPTAPLRVTIGRTVLNSKQGQVRRVSSIFVHPDYRPNRNSAYDVAVLKLSGSVSGIQPIKLATVNQNYLENPGRKLTVAGWGDMREVGGNYPNRMREVSVPVVSDAKAQRAYSSQASVLQYFPSLMVAAGVKGKDHCYGDSGGPLFKPGTPSTQVGIASYAKGCARAGYPGVSTEVNNPKIRNFILAAARR